MKHVSGVRTFAYEQKKRKQKKTTLNCWRWRYFAWLFCSVFVHISLCSSIEWSKPMPQVYLCFSKLIVVVQCLFCCAFADLHYYYELVLFAAAAVCNFKAFNVRAYSQRKKEHTQPCAQHKSFAFILYTVHNDRVLPCMRRQNDQMLHEKKNSRDLKTEIQNKCFRRAKCPCLVQLYVRCALH